MRDWAKRLKINLGSAAIRQQVKSIAELQEEIRIFNKKTNKVQETISSTKRADKKQLKSATQPILDNQR